MTLKAKRIAMDKLSTGTRLLMFAFSLIILTVLFEVLLDMDIVFTISTPEQMFQIFFALTGIFIGTGLFITARIYRTFSDKLSLSRIKQVHSNRSLRTFWPIILNTVFILVLCLGILSIIYITGRNMLLIPVAMAVIIENINNTLINLSGLVIIEYKPEEQETIQQNTQSKSFDTKKKALSAEEIDKLSDDELERLFKY